jgi:hypothetical protein
MEKNGLMELLIKLGLSPPLLRFSVNPAAYYGSPRAGGQLPLFKAETYISNRQFQQFDFAKSRKHAFRK